MVYDELFNGKENLSETDKAKIIYKYIQDNIAYSSVSFRQSNYIPQKPMVTISTKLGDCKDVSTLYHTLAKKAGLKTNLVLVNTRYNGENHMKFPSTSFNHCIIRIQADGDTLYQELTDNKLPFGVSPHTINNAQALVIPNEKGEDTGTKGLIHIKNKIKIENALIRNSSISINEDNLVIQTTLAAQGDKSSSYRRNLSDLTKDEMNESVESYIGQYFTQDYSILEHSVKNIEEIDSSIDFTIKFEVKDVLKEIGSIKTFHLPMFDEILSLQNLSNEDRTHPLEYWRYEDVRIYQNNYEIDFGKDHILFELPKDVSIENEYFSYSLKFEKVSANKIKVERIFKPFLGTVNPESYKDFREIISKILKEENIYISLKEK